MKRYKISIPGSEAEVIVLADQFEVADNGLLRLYTKGSIVAAFHSAGWFKIVEVQATPIP